MPNHVATILTVTGKSVKTDLKLLEALMGWDK